MPNPLANLQTRRLTAFEVDDVLSRNGTLRNRVYQFRVMDLFLQYEQSDTSESFLEWLVTFHIPSPIPPYGLEVVDQRLGKVVVFPDDDGDLIFTAIPATIHSGAERIPSGGYGLPTLPQITGSLVAVGIVALLVLRATK